MIRGTVGQGRPLGVWLAKKGYNKTSFGKKMGVTRQTVDNWLKRGRAWPHHAEKIYNLMVADGVRPALLHKCVKERWRLHLDAENRSRL